MPIQRNKGAVAVLFKRQCKYVGSIAVSGSTPDDCLAFVTEKMNELKESCKGVNVNIMVTEEGIKVLSDNETCVKMAHSITCTQFSTCQPKRCIFAYVAKSKQPDNTVIDQSHMFRLKRSTYTQQLNNSLTKAFRMAYMRKTVNRQFREKVFVSDVMESQPKPACVKRWAKQEMARGHELSSHAIKAKEKPEEKLIESNEIAAKVSPYITDKNKNIVNSWDKVDLEKVKERKAKEDPNAEDEKLDKNKEDDTSVTKVNKVIEKSLVKKTHSVTEPILRSSEVLFDRPRHKSCPNIDELSQQSSLRRKNAIKSMSCGNQASCKVLMFDKKDRNVSASVTPIRTSKAFSEIVIPEVEYVNVEQMYQDYLNKENNTEQDNIENSEEFEISKEDSNKNEHWQDLITFSAKVEDSPVNDSEKLSIDEQILKESGWYQPGYSREIADELLFEHCIGSFFIRKSGKQGKNYVLSLRVPASVKDTGVVHFIIEPVKGGHCLSGFPRVFTTIVDLVTHHGSTDVDLPVQLSLAQDNPLLYYRRQYVDEPDMNEEKEVEDEESDPDYETFESTNEIMKELENLLELS